jgi:hypothetical protein
MSVTVTKAWTAKPFVWHTDKDRTHALVWSSTLYLEIREVNGKKRNVMVHFKGRDDEAGSKCYRCDGLSVPKMFRWFLPDWDEKNQLYNLAGALHDWLYASEGNYCMFSRSECDDMFRGILRESGQSRFKAGTADYMVGLFAGNGHHWGNDNYNIADTVKMEFV